MLTLSPDAKLCAGGPPLSLVFGHALVHAGVRSRDVVNHEAVGEGKEKDNRMNRRNEWLKNE